MLVHPNKRQLKRECTVCLKKSTICWKASPVPFPYLCQAPAENDKPIWQLKSRSGGEKKLLLLPNFDECKDGVVTTFKGTPSVALRALSLSLDCLPVRTALSLRWNTDRLGLMCVTFQKTIADDARFSPTVSPICPPSCSNTPEKILQMSGTGHAQVYITNWKATRCCSQTLKSCLNVMISLKIYHPRKNKLKLSLKIFIFNVDI